MNRHLAIPAIIISVILLSGTLGYTFSNPDAFASDDDDEDEGIKQCVEDCIDNFLDAMDECDELEVGPEYDLCVNVAEFELFVCLFEVDGPACLPLVIPIVCGDGILEFGEECDDGNNDDGDGCSAVCTLEPPGPGSQ